MQSRNLINVFCHVYLALSANVNFAGSVRWAVGQLSFQQHTDLCFTAVLNSGSSIHWLYYNPTTAKTGWANVTKTREHDWGTVITACVESAAHSGSREGSCEPTTLHRFNPRISTSPRKESRRGDIFKRHSNNALAASYTVNIHPLRATN